MSKPPPTKHEDKLHRWIDRTWYWCGKLTGGKCEKCQHQGKDCGVNLPNKRRKFNNNKSNEYKDDKDKPDN